MKVLSKTKSLFFIVAFAVAGTVLLIISRAATPSVSLNPEAGSLSGCATTINDNTADGQAAIGFNSTCGSTSTDLSAIPDSSYDPTGGVFVDAINGNDNGTGSQSSPYKTLTKAVQAVASGGKIVLRSGTYREGTLKSDGTNNATLRSISKPLTIQAYPHEQAWLDGTEIVTGWTQSGNVWVLNNSPSRFLCKPSIDACITDPSQVDSGGPMASSPQMVFKNGSYLNEVGTQAEVGPGKFYFNQSTNQLVIGDNPTGATIEVTVQRRAINFGGTATGSKLLGVGVRRYGSILNTSSVNSDYAFAMVTTSGTAGMLIEGNLFYQSASMGANTAAGSHNAVVRKNVFYKNGGVGFGGSTQNNMLFEQNTVSANNQEKFSFSNSTHATIAGVKVVKQTGSIFKNNIIENNDSNGWWCDIDCNGVVAINNIVRNNAKHGMYYEISTNGTIASNIIYKNGSYGIKNSSDNTKIYNNTVVRNHQAILIYHDTRHIADTVTVRNNIFSNNDGSTASLFDTNPSSVTTGVDETLATLDHNVFHRDSSTKPSTLIRWCKKGGACTNYSTLSAFKTATGKEAHGLGFDQLDPFFISESTNNYQLRAGTSLFGSGEALPTSLASLLGVSANNPSMGALPWPAN